MRLYNIAILVCGFMQYYVSIMLTWMASGVGYDSSVMLFFRQRLSM